MIRVLIASDIRLYLEGLSGIIGGHENFQVVGTCTSVDLLLKAVEKRSPQVILLDMAMRNSIMTARTVNEIAPSILIVALGVLETPEEIISCAQAGISNFVTRQGSGSDLVQVVLDTVKGEMRCPPKITSSLFRKIGAMRSDSSTEIEPTMRLTKRELQVAQLIEIGLSNKEIATRLFIEVSTVKNHVHNLLEKLNVNSRGQAAAQIRPLLAEHAARSSFIDH